MTQKKYLQNFKNKFRYFAIKNENKPFQQPLVEFAQELPNLTNESVRKTPSTKDTQKHSRFSTDKNCGFARQNIKVGNQRCFQNLEQNYWIKTGQMQSHGYSSEKQDEPRRSNSRSKKQSSPLVRRTEYSKKHIEGSMQLVPIRTTIFRKDVSKKPTDWKTFKLFRKR